MEQKLIDIINKLPLECKISSKKYVSFEEEVRDIIYNTYDIVKFKPNCAYELLEQNSKQIPENISLFSMVCLDRNIDDILIFLEFYKHNKIIFEKNYIDSPFIVLFNCYELHEDFVTIINLFKYYMMYYEDCLKNICNDINFLIDLNKIPNIATIKYIVNYLFRMNWSIFNSNFDPTLEQLAKIYKCKYIAKKIYNNFDKFEYLFKLRNYYRNTIYDIICYIDNYYEHEYWIIKSPYKNEIIEYFPEYWQGILKEYEIFNESNIKAVEN